MPSFFAWPPAARSRRAALSRPQAAGGRRRRHLLRPRGADHRGARPPARAERGGAAAPPGDPRRLGRGQVVLPAGGPAAAAGRDAQTFLPLPVIRPERAALYGETGFVSALEGACEAASLKMPRADLRERRSRAARPTLKPLLARLQPQRNARPSTARPASASRRRWSSPIDQGEELFLAEAQERRERFSRCCATLVACDAPAVIAIFTIRSDNYERLQSAQELEGVHQETLNLPPMPKGAYAEVIKGPPPARWHGAGAQDRRRAGRGPACRHRGGRRQGRAAAARLHSGAPLRRIRRHRRPEARPLRPARPRQGLDRGGGRAGAQGSRQRRAHPPRPRGPATLLRRGLIPWLAGIDPETGAPRRRVARLSEIPAEARPLIDQLVEQRLLSTDVAKDTGRDAPSSRRTRRCCANGVCCRAGSRRIRPSHRARRYQARGARLGRQYDHGRGLLIAAAAECGRASACARRPGRQP